MASSSSSTHADGGGIGTMLSRLSIHNFDADEKLGLYDYYNKYGQLDDDDDDDKYYSGFLSSGSDHGTGGGGGGWSYSLPATPQRTWGYPSCSERRGVKEYGSENEAVQQIKNTTTQQGRRRRRRRSVLRPQKRRAEGDCDDDDELIMNDNRNSTSSNSSSSSSLRAGGSGDESSHHHDGGNLMVITSKGSSVMLMDLEEVKACRDLGFDFELVVLPIAITSSCASASATSTSSASGSTSPMSHRRISSPGDDPRDVKARLKVWAQAVALASASRHNNTT